MKNKKPIPLFRIFCLAVLMDDSHTNNDPFASYNPKFLVNFSSHLLPCHLNHHLLIYHIISSHFICHLPKKSSQKPSPISKNQTWMDGQCWFIRRMAPSNFCCKICRCLNSSSCLCLCLFLWWYVYEYERRWNERSLKERYISQQINKSNKKNLDFILSSSLFLNTIEHLLLWS